MITTGFSPTAQVQVEEQEQVFGRTQALPPWKVILWNDEVHWAHDVALALVDSVQGLSSQHAWEITIQADRTGSAVVIACPKEQAELYQERLQTFGLTVTIEAD